MEHVSTTVLEFQMKADEVLTSGKGIYGNTEMDSVEWFEVARCLISLLVAAETRSLPGLNRMFALPGLLPQGVRQLAAGKSFELLGPRDRVRYLSLLDPLLPIGAGGLIGMAREAGVTMATLRLVRRGLPTILEQMAAQLESPELASWPQVDGNSGPQPRSRESVRKQWARMVRRMAGNRR